MRVDGCSLGARCLDRERARAAFRALGELRDELAPGPRSRYRSRALSPTCSFPRSTGRSSDSARQRGRRSRSPSSALDAMRAREGIARREDLIRRLEPAYGGCRAADRRARARRSSRPTGNACARGPTDCVPHGDQRRRCATRAGIALFAERSDVCEELTRWRATAPSSRPCSPATTPSADASISSARDGARGQHGGREEPGRASRPRHRRGEGRIERMREQVQNVE